MIIKEVKIIKVNNVDFGWYKNRGFCATQSLINGRFEKTIKELIRTKYLVFN